MLRTLGLGVLAICASFAIAPALVEPQAPALNVFTTDDWLGVWLDGKNVVWISANPDDTLSVVGAAYETSGGRTIDARLDFEAIPRGSLQNVVLGGDSDCAAQLTNLRHSLVVEDNGRCKGGAIRFDGVYTHQ
jgi:hypothetical protein